MARRLLCLALFDYRNDIMASAVQYPASGALLPGTFVRKCDHEDTLQQMLDHGSRYNNLGKHLGRGIVLVLGNDLPESYWTKLLPKSETKPAFKTFLRNVRQGETATLALQYSPLCHSLLACSCESLGSVQHWPPTLVLKLSNKIRCAYLSWLSSRCLSTLDQVCRNTLTGACDNNPTHYGYRSSHILQRDVSSIHDSVLIAPCIPVKGKLSRAIRLLYSDSMVENTEVPFVIMSFQTDLAGSLGLDTSSDDSYDSLGASLLLPNFDFDPVQASKSYWLGRIFMRYAQAHAILMDADPGESVTDCDVRLEERLREYPLTESLEHLLQCTDLSIPHGLRNNTRTDDEAFCCAIGHILCNSNRLDSQENCILFRGLQYRGDGLAAHWAEAIRTKGFSDEPQSPPVVFTPKVEIYYDVLNDYAKKVGEELKRESQKRDSAWIVTLTVKGRDFIGKDVAIDEALAKASQKGCHAFGLEVV
nr:hypothetical protein CFP56_33421 [Quercus suber]